MLLRIERAPRAPSSTLLPLLVLLLAAPTFVLGSACQPEEEEPGCIVGINCAPPISNNGTNNGTNNGVNNGVNNGDNNGDNNGAPDMGDGEDMADGVDTDGDDMADPDADPDMDVTPDMEGDAQDMDPVDMDPGDMEDMEVDPDADPDMPDAEGCTQDSECADDQYCDGGACVAGCHNNDGCGPGLECDLDVHRCLTPGCQVDSDCPPAAWCQGEVCVPGCHRDEGCPEGEVCIIDTHSCEDPGCRDDSDCPGLQTCDTQTGECQSLGVCFSADDCPQGQLCVNGSCSEDAPECRDTGDCPQGQSCVRNMCEPDQCTDDEECLEGRRCKPGDSICVDCTQDAHCSNGTVCETISGSCVLPSNNCTNDAQCPGNQVCDLGTGECTEVQNVVCVEDADCGPGGTCQEGLCAGNTCTGDEDCVGDRTCQAGTCVGATCANDGQEPDNSIAQASALTPQTQTQTLCEQDVDVFQVDVAAGDGFAVIIGFDPLFGSAEADLLDSNGNIVNTSFSTSEGQVVVSLEASMESSVWYVQLRHVQGRAFDYTVRYVPQTGGFCANDDYEPNNNSGVASDASPGSFVRGRVCDGDEDWYVLRIPDGRSQLLLTINTVEGDNGVGVEIYNALQGQPQVRDVSPQEIKSFTLTRDEGATRYVRIYSVDSDIPELYFLENFAQ